MIKPIIIVGSGLAGYNLVREIRQRDKNIAITMITEDQGHFYSKPMLSTSLALGKSVHDLLTMPAEKMAEQYGIEVITQTVVRKILVEENAILVDTPHQKNNQLFYGDLVLCIGANTRLPELEGNARSDVVQINDVYHYHSFREKILNKKKIVILGAGLVGCEFANDLTHAGYQVDIVDPNYLPIAGLLPQPVGAALMMALEKQGVHWHLGHTAQAIHHAERAYQVTLNNGIVIDSELVLSAIGLKPRITIAREAGLMTNRGIVVNEFLKTTGSTIYAMGDCAELNGWLLPYIAPIMQCAKALAATLTGNPTPLSLPAMPVSIKTSCYPIAVCQPPFYVEASWHYEEKEGVLRAYLRDNKDKLWGFVLTKEATKDRITLAQSLERWL